MPKRSGPRENCAAVKLALSPRASADYLERVLAGVARELGQDEAAAWRHEFLRHPDVVFPDNLVRLDHWQEFRRRCVAHHAYGWLYYHMTAHEKPVTCYPILDACTFGAHVLPKVQRGVAWQHGWNPPAALAARARSTLVDCGHGEWRYLPKLLRHAVPRVVGFEIDALAVTRAYMDVLRKLDAPQRPRVFPVPATWEGMDASDFGEHAVLMGYRPGTPPPAVRDASRAVHIFAADGKGTEGWDVRNDARFFPYSLEIQSRSWAYGGTAPVV